MRLPRWCSGWCLLFCSRRKAKRCREGMKVRKMGTGCSNRLGSASAQMRRSYIFHAGWTGRPAPVCRHRLPTFLWINHAFGASQLEPTPPHALMTRTREGSLATCDPGYSVCTGDVSIAVGHDQPPEHNQWVPDTELLDSGRHAQPHMDNANEGDT